MEVEAVDAMVLKEDDLVIGRRDCGAVLVVYTRWQGQLGEDIPDSNGDTHPAPFPGLGLGPSRGIGFDSACDDPSRAVCHAPSPDHPYYSACVGLP